MTTFRKTKFNIADDNTNIDKYKLVANITEYKISNLVFPSNFQVKEEKKYSNRSINKDIGLLWSRWSFEGKYNIAF